MLRILVIEQGDQKPHYENAILAAPTQDVMRAHVVIVELPDGNFILAKSRYTVPGNVFPSVEEAIEYSQVLRRNADVS